MLYDYHFSSVDAIPRTVKQLYPCVQCKLNILAQTLKISIIYLLYIHIHLQRHLIGVKVGWLLLPRKSYICKLDCFANLIYGTTLEYGAILYIVLPLYF